MSMKSVSAVEPKGRDVVFIHPTDRFSEVKQRAALKDVPRSAPEYVETHKPVRYAQRAQMVRSLRRNDRLWLPAFHVLATTREDLKEIAEKIIGMGVIVIDASTGQRSDSPGALVRMGIEAADHYAARITGERARKYGRKGAAASPVAKPKTGHMPHTAMSKILNDRSLTFAEAVAAIWADDRYETKLSLATIRRRIRDGQIKYRQRPAGKRPKPKI